MKKRKKREPKPLINPPLLYAEASAKDIQTFILERLSAPTINLFLILKLWMNTSNGSIHKKQIVELADYLGVDEKTVYKSIATLNRVGLFNPSKDSTIGGTLPSHNQLKRDKAIAKQEARERKFYQALRKRIQAWENENGQLIDRDRLIWQFTVLVGERKDSNGYCPKDDRRTRLNLFDNLEKYAPLGESDLFASIEK